MRILVGKLGVGILHARDRDRQVSWSRIPQKQVWGGLEPRQFIWEAIPGDQWGGDEGG